MKTIKQSICVDFKAVELEDAMKVAPLMDTLNRSLSEKETCTIQMPREMVCNVLKTLSDFGFRMSDGSYYKKLSEEMNSPSETEADLIPKGSKLIFSNYHIVGPRLEVIKTIKDYLCIGLKEAKDAADMRTIILPHDITKDTFDKLRFKLADLGVDCCIAK